MARGACRRARPVLALLVLLRHGASLRNPSAPGAPRRGAGSTLQAEVRDAEAAGASAHSALRTPADAGAAARGAPVAQPAAAHAAAPSSALVVASTTAEGAERDEAAAAGEAMFGPLLMVSYRKFEGGRTITFWHDSLFGQVLFEQQLQEAEENEPAADKAAGVSHEESFEERLGGMDLFASEGAWSGEGIAELPGAAAVGAGRDRCMASFSATTMFGGKPRAVEKTVRGTCTGLPNLKRREELEVPTQPLNEWPWRFFDGPGIRVNASEEHPVEVNDPLLGRVVLTEGSVVSYSWMPDVEAMLELLAKWVEGQDDSPAGVEAAARLRRRWPAHMPQAPPPPPTAASVAAAAASHNATPAEEAEEADEESLMPAGPWSGSGPGNFVGSPLEILQNFAMRKRREADGVDSEAQSYWLLMAMEFEEVRRITGEPFQLRAALEDLETIEELSRATPEVLARHDFRERTNLHRGGRPKDFAIDTFAQFFLGARRLRQQQLLQLRNGKKANVVVPSRSTYVKGLETQQARALIFTCSFGGGHQSAASAVSEYLTGAGMHVESVDANLDPEMTSMTQQKSVEFFNQVILKRRMYAITNAGDSFHNMLKIPKNTRCPAPECNSDRKHQFRTAVLRRRPHLVISVYHMELVSILEVAKELGNIGVIHLATDMDAKMREIFVSSTAGPIYPRFRVGVPYDIEKSWKTTEPLPASATFLSGYPVRREFLQPYDPARVAEERRRTVPPGTRILLMMTGGGGQDVQTPYLLAKKGWKAGHRLHIIVVAGANNDLETQYAKRFDGRVTMPDGREVFQGRDRAVTLEVARDPANTREDRPYFVLGPRLALLMDVADVILSKPGGGSTAEVAYRGTPALFDVSASLFHWEQFTVDAFVEAGRAITFNSFTSLQDGLEKALEMGRSRVLVESDGHFVNPEANIVNACHEMLSMTPEPGWRLFRPGSKAYTLNYLYASLALVALAVMVGLCVVKRGCGRGLCWCWPEPRAARPGEGGRKGSRGDARSASSSDVSVGSLAQRLREGAEKPRVAAPAAPPPVAAPEAERPARPAAAG